MIPTDFWPARATAPTTTAVGCVPVTPSDVANNITAAGGVEHVALALYVTTGGTIKITCADGSVDTLTVGDKQQVNVPVVRVWATGTTAAGVHALI